MLEHGGQLRSAAARYGIPLADWLDLSTGINPNGWPVPVLPGDVWQRLPEENDGLEAAAAAYYGNPDGLAVAGSQAAIQSLPTILPRAAVTCLAPLYGEHPEAWQRAGHQVRLLHDATLQDALAAGTPYVLLCNPNNPTARRQVRAELLDAARQLDRRGGKLIIDEAFIDALPAESLTPLAGSEDASNLIVLRSLGKFFGLAGARVGFVFATQPIREQMVEAMGPWTVSGPARAIARLALADLNWQAAERLRLQAAGRRLHDLLAGFGAVAATPLFATLQHAQANALHEHLAQRAILTRRFPAWPLLRVGLPASETAWQRLAAALATWSPP